MGYNRSTKRGPEQLEHNGFDVRWDVLVLSPVHNVERPALRVKAKPPGLQYRRGEVSGAYSRQRRIKRLRFTAAVKRWRRRR